MTTFTTTYYAYDKSHRMTKQYVLGGEAHYFTYNERDMIASIQDFNGAGDANRYFTYNGVGERVLMRDSATNLSYLTYDGSKLLTEKTETGKVFGRYRHNESRLDRVRGSGLESAISDGTVTYFSNPAYDHTGNMRYAFGNESGNVSYVYNAVGQQLLTPGGAVSGKALATSRLQGLAGYGFQQLTTMEPVSVVASVLLLQAQAVFAALGATTPPLAFTQGVIGGGMSRATTRLGAGLMRQLVAAEVVVECTTGCSESGCERINTMVEGIVVTEVEMPRPGDPKLTGRDAEQWGHDVRHLLRRELQEQVTIEERERQERQCNSGCICQPFSLYNPWERTLLGQPFELTRTLKNGMTYKVTGHYGAWQRKYDGWCRDNSLSDISRIAMAG